jgi:hypothetical protein
MDKYQGVIDNQTEEQKAKNYLQSEVVASIAPVVWLEKTQENWRHFPIRDQDGSFTCVCQCYATMLGIIFQQKYGVWIDFSASFPYQQRSNKDISGCSSVDIFSNFPKLGNVYESLMTSQFMSEEQIMSAKRENYYADLAKVYQIKRIALPIDFETVASTIQATGKGVDIWVKFSGPEWTDKPQVLDQPTTSGHSICAVDYVLVDGKKYLVIDDSWGLAFAIKGQRLISEEYFNTRCFQASYLMTFQVQNNDTVAFRPVFDGSIVSAQKCFKWEGLFPANVAEVENWGNITRTACIAFQKRFNITPALGNFGPITQAKLKELYK